MSGRVLTTLVAAAALAGCSLGDDDEPKPITGVPRQVAATIDRLERATRERDWATICSRLFTKAALKRAGGRDCPRLLRETASDVRGAEIRVVSIDLSGDRARAHVRTRSAGQALTDDTILLEREDGEWRIDSLAAG